jgi:hypothetical protein
LGVEEKTYGNNPPSTSGMPKAIHRTP